jgi:hypothetical protein
MSDSAGNSQRQKPPQDQPKINCDQVAWLGDILDRHAAAVLDARVRISRGREAAKLAAILEIMEIVNVGFADNTARGNAIAQFPELRRQSETTSNLKENGHHPEGEAVNGNSPRSNDSLVAGRG